MFALAEAAGVALLVGFGIGYGGQLYMPHMPPAGIDYDILFILSGILVGVVSYGVICALIFLPLEGLLLLAWAALRLLRSQRGGVLSRFRWYYLPVAYAVGIAIGFVLAVVGMYPYVAS